MKKRIGEVSGYARDIDEELKDMFHNRWREVKDEIMKISTHTRIKVLESTVAEHDGIFDGMFKRFTAAFGGLTHMDEKLKGKK